MLEASARSKPFPIMVPVEEVESQFVAHFEGFDGTLLELAASLRAGKIRPVDVPLMQLTRAVLERFHALRTELEISGSVNAVDLASEALPHLAGVIELKTRLLLPKPPQLPKEEGEDAIDAELEDVLSGVEALARLEGAIQFLRDRRRERALLLVAQVPPIKLPRKQKPLSKGLSELVAAAKRRVLEVNMFELALDRLTLPQALLRLRDFAKRLKKFFLHDIPTQDWGERTIVFAAMLEGVKMGEVEAEQAEMYGHIAVRSAD